MAPNVSQPKTLDPVDALNDCLERVWRKLCNCYDAGGGLPELPSIFDKVNLSNPSSAAEKVLVNMLLELMECICRFSPWYTKPPRALGLISYRDTVSNKTRWMLAPEAAQKWEEVLIPLTEAIEKFNGLIHAMLLVDDLMGEMTPDDPIVTASCNCSPPRAIHLQRSILVKTEIICDQCKQPYNMV